MSNDTEREKNKFHDKENVGCYGITNFKLRAREGSLKRLISRLKATDSKATKKMKDCFRERICESMCAKAWRTAQQVGGSEHLAQMSHSMLILL